MKNKTDAQKYREMIKLYQIGGYEKEALEIARELMTSLKLSPAKNRDVEHVYFNCGGK